MNRLEVFNRINLAREAMDKRWGTGSIDKMAVEKPYLVVAILTEEVGEVARACLEKDGDNLKAELLDVLQICTAWLEAL